MRNRRLANFVRLLSMPDLTPPGKALPIGLLFLAAALCTAAGQALIGFIAPWVGVFALLVGLVVGVRVWVRERRINPNARAFEPGSPFMWGADLALASGLGLVCVVGAVAGYGAIIWTTVRFVGGAL